MMNKNCVDVNDNKQSRQNPADDNNDEKIMSGKDILRFREEKLLEYEERDQINAEKTYDAFCEKISERWKKDHIEESLVKKGEGFIRGNYYDLSMDKNNMNEFRLAGKQSRQISEHVRPKIHKKASNSDFYECVYTEKETYDRMIREEFDINPGHLRTFMNENDFEFDLGIFVSEVTIPAYFSLRSDVLDIFHLLVTGTLQTLRNKRTALKFQYVLRIRCKNDSILALQKVHQMNGLAETLEQLEQR